MGLLILTSTSFTDIQLVETFSRDRQGQTQMQVVSVSLSGTLFSFVYIRTSPTHAEAEWLLEKTRNSSYILGDLNLQPDIANQMRLIEVISGDKTMILRSPTTPQKSQLDHILGPESDVHVYATSYLNFCSDHYCITLRVPQHGADFVDDERLREKSKQQELSFHQPAPPTPKTKRTRLQAAGTPKKRKKKGC